jgi:autotransporter-associated beta strand protein
MQPLRLRRYRKVILAAAISAVIPCLQLSAAIVVWDGGGVNDNWSTARNWVGDTAPVANDALQFDGFARLTPANDFTANTAFNGLTFTASAGAFTLSGNTITLGGDIADNTAVLTQTINLPLVLSATRTVAVTSNGFLVLGGTISGASSGLTKTGSGLLTLTGNNSFGGPLVINAGAVSVSSDGNLGAAPAAATAGQLVIDGGTLRTTTTFTINANRGISVGPSTGTGTGTIDVTTGTTVTYGGVIANNGAGTGGLTKSSFGGLTLSGANTYTGPTAVLVGTLTLDFTQPTSPVSNIISSSSALTLGGSNAGLGGTSFAALTMMGGASANTQTFNGTTIDIGPAIVRANSSGAGSATLNLGALTHNPGGVVNFVRPTIGNINTTTPNTNGIIGGWATVGTGAQAAGITVGNEWAAVDGSGNIVPFAGHLNYATGSNIGNVLLYPPGSNVRINNGSSGDVTVDTPNAGTTTDINTLQFSEAAARSIRIGTNNTLRLGKSGGIFRSDAITAGVVWVIGTSTGGANGIPNDGTLTAGGAPDTSGEIVFTINAPSQTNGGLNVEVKVADNGTGAVSVVKAGPGSMKFRGKNTYSGGTYILQGRFQLAGSELGAANANPDGFGTGPIFVMPGGQAFPSGVGTTTPITNAWFLAGNGISDNVGAIRLSNGGELSGLMTLIGDTRLGGGGANNSSGAAGGGRITGKITGPFNLDFGAAGNSGSGHNVAIISNPANDWTGNTTIVGRTGTDPGNTRLVLGANEVIPNGVGKGNVIIGNANNTASTTTLDLNGFNETINGLSSAGTVTMGFVQNGGAVPSTLTIGDYDQTSVFAGVIQDGAAGVGGVGITKIGSGILTLSGTNTYTGETNVNAGTLAITGAGAGLSATGVVNVNSSATAAGTLSGTGAVGLVTLAANTGSQIATIAPGATGAFGTVGTLTMASLTVNGGNLQFDLVNPGPSASDFIDVTGAASFNAASTISPGPLGAAGTYTLLTAAGGLTLTVPPTINAPANTRSTFALNTGTPNSLKLDVAGGPKALTWTGATNSTWDVVNTTNWTDGAIAEKFFNNDSVTFTDAGANRDINLAVSVLPSAVTVNNTLASDYAIRGGGSIDGTASFTKSGNGRLIVATTNSYTGPTTITGGTVEVGDGGAFGSLGTGTIANEGLLIFGRGDVYTAPNVISGTGELRKTGLGTLTLSGTSTYTGLTSINIGTVRVTNASIDVLSPGSSLGDTILGGTVNILSGAALDLSGSTTAQALNFGAKQFNIAGSGVGGTGVLTNSGTIGQNNAFQHVTLTADATVGGTGRFDIRGGGSNLDLAGFTLTKRGTNQVSLVDTTVTDGDIVVEQGIFSFETGTTAPISPTLKKITYNNGTTAQFFNLAGGVTRQFVLNGNVTMGNASPGVSILNSDITLNGDLTVTNLNNSTGALTLAGNITETGGPWTLTKTGGTILTLQGNNTYSGVTNLNGGLVEFVTLNNLGTNPAINFSGGGLLYGSNANNIDVSTRTLTFNSGGGTIDTNLFDVTFANPIGNNGVGGFTKAGAGTLTFINANTYSGPTSINGGTIQFSSLNQLGTGTAVNFNGGTLLYASGSGNIDITSRAVTLNVNGGRIDTNGNSVTFGGSISGIGGLEKLGAGTLTLLGNSNYTGATTLSEGTLLVGGSLAGALNVLGGILQLGASERFPDTAAVMLGNAIFDTKGFSETVGILSLTSSSTLELGQNASIARFAESTSTFWTGLLSITNWSGSPSGGGTDQVFFGSNELGLTFDQVAAIQFVDPFGPGTGIAPAQILVTGEIVPIPEPGALAALLGGLGMLALRRRRHDAKAHGHAGRR